jgi:ribosome biogenesis GTPase
MSLARFGWDRAWDAAFGAWAQEPGVEPARVVIEFNHIYRVAAERGEVEATLAGRLKHRAASRSELPAVGDWVALRAREGRDGAAIVGVLPRRSRFSRKAAGLVTDEQVVAANVDLVFLVMGLDADFSVRRLERYLLTARESGAEPVVVLTKPDRAQNLAEQVAAARAVSAGIALHVTSPRWNEGLAPLAALLDGARTGALLGSSGVGKSTIVNRLVGEDVQRIREVREADAKGRHATTHRELVVLPNGGLLIDTPGMRELQLWDVGDAVRGTFEDVEAFASGCHFTDCRHRGEPRCAVREAVDRGALDPDRLVSYQRLQDELQVLARQQDERAQRDARRRARVDSKALNKHLKTKRG